MTAALSGSAASARADVALPESAVIVRNAVVAMSLADAALPCAAAVALQPADVWIPQVSMPQVSVPQVSVAVLKPATSDAIAAMRPTRRSNAVAETASLERRWRPYREVFPLIIGIGF